MPGTNTELFSREAATVGVRKDQVTVQQVQQRGLDSEGRRLSSEEWAERRKAAREREEEEKAHSPACKLCGLDIGDDAMRCNVPRAGLPSTPPATCSSVRLCAHALCYTHSRGMGKSARGLSGIDEQSISAVNGSDGQDP